MGQILIEKLIFDQNNKPVNNTVWFFWLLILVSAVSSPLATTNHAAYVFIKRHADFVTRWRWWVAVG